MQKIGNMTAMTPSASSDPQHEILMEQCDIHGPYPLNRVDGGQVRWYPGGCPACRTKARADKLINDAAIPPRFAGCTLDNYQTPTPAHEDVLARCKTYAESFGEARRRGASLVLCGRPGTGKNHLSAGVLRRVSEMGYSVLRIKAAAYADAYWGKPFDAREDWMIQLAAVDLLAIDEIGRGSEGKPAQDAMFRLIDARYEAMAPMVVTTNLRPERLEAAIGAESYDRLRQGGGIRLTLNWDSYRAGAEK